uniref:Retrotransposon Copia-like N-terminal domain-containing protein n=1 Tax=Cannabis sativa TaxID=3483 RepID=A0A803PHG1_CANSA
MMGLVDASAAPPPPSKTSVGTLPCSAPPVPGPRLDVIDRPAYEDIRSPYYLSNADHLGLALATPLLTDRNFQPWKRDFKLSIGARNKTPFLEGNLPQPSPTNALYSSWTRCNLKVMSWILHYVSPKIKSCIMYLDSAAEMWSVLNNWFNQGNGPRIFKFNETLTYLHQGDDSVSSYFTKLTAMWDEINQLRPRINCTCVAAILKLKDQIRSNSSDVSYYGNKYTFRSISE